jgi:hypothetical protein
MASRLAKDPVHNQSDPSMAEQANAKAAGISDAAVQAKTGKTWTEWFAILDQAGAAAWPHK